MQRFAMLAKIGGIFSNTRNRGRGLQRDSNTERGEDEPEQIEVQPRRPSVPTRPLSPQPGPSGVNTSTYRSSRGPSNVVLESLGHLTIDVDSDDEYDESELPSPYYKFRHIPKQKTTKLVAPAKKGGPSLSPKRLPKQDLDESGSSTQPTPKVKDSKPPTKGSGSQPPPKEKVSHPKQTSSGTHPLKEKEKSKIQSQQKLEENFPQKGEGGSRSELDRQKEKNRSREARERYSRQTQQGVELSTFETLVENVVRLKLKDSKKGQQKIESESQQNAEDDQRVVHPDKNESDSEHEKNGPSPKIEESEGESLPAQDGKEPSQPETVETHSTPEEEPVDGHLREETGDTIQPSSGTGESRPDESSGNNVPQQVNAAEPGQEAQINTQGNSLRRRRRNRDIVLDNLGDLFSLEDEENEEANTEPKQNLLSPLYILLNAMCFVGISPCQYDYEGNITNYLKKIPYYIVHTLLFLQSVLLTRRCFWMAEFITGDSEISSYIHLGRSVIQIILRWAFFITMILKKNKITKLIKNNDNPMFKELLVYKSAWDWLPFILLGTLSLVIVLLKTFMFDFKGEENIIQALFKTKSTITTSLITSGNMEENLIALRNISKESITYSQALVGSVSISWELYCYMMDQFCGLLIAILAVNLLSTAKCLEFKSWNLSVNKTALINNYRKWKIKGQLINNIISIIYPIFLIDNLFHLAICYDSSFNPALTKLDKALLGLEVLQILLIFIIGHIIANKVKEKREWVHNECYDAVEEPRLYLLLEEMTSMPVGIGDDFLYICKSFIFNFFALSFAYFFSVVETRKSLSSCK